MIEEIFIVWPFPFIQSLTAMLVRSGSVDMKGECRKSQTSHWKCQSLAGYESMKSRYRPVDLFEICEERLTCCGYSSMA